jgi:serine/threonine protein phosphatase PrpC
VTQAQSPNSTTTPQSSPIHFGNFQIGFATDIGRRRMQNQDSFAVAPDIGLFLIADGMGGHQGGEIASAIVSDVVPKAVRTYWHDGKVDARRALSEAIEKANAAIFDYSQKNTSLQGMGTTTTALLFHDKQLTIGHVGDSRCYYFKPMGHELVVWQATRDHSLVQEKLRAGLITRDEIKTDRMKNVITRSVGFESDVTVELYQMNVEPGDVFLICSDGLSGMMDDTTMRNILTENLLKRNDVDLAVRSLIAKANSNGGEDNVTTVVVQVK